MASSLVGTVFPLAACADMRQASEGEALRTVVRSAVTARAEGPDREWLLRGSTDGATGDDADTDAAAANAAAATRVDIACDLVLNCVAFCLAEGFCDAKVSAAAAVLWRLLRQAAVEAPPAKACVALLHDLLAAHAVERPPAAVQLFTVPETVVLHRYAADTFLRHHAAYLHAFSTPRTLRLHAQPRVFVARCPAPFRALSLATAVAAASTDDGADSDEAAAAAAEGGGADGAEAAAEGAAAAAAAAAAAEGGGGAEEGEAGAAATGGGEGSAAAAAALAASGKEGGGGGADAAGGAAGECVGALPQPKRFKEKLEEISKEVVAMSDEKLTELENKVCSKTFGGCWCSIVFWLLFLPSFSIFPMTFINCS